MSSELPDDWWVEHTGERLVLDQEKVAAEIERLRKERDELSYWMSGIAGFAKNALNALEQNARGEQ